MSIEILPDELLLQICRYLHSSDILLSFCGLNFRFNRTIGDFIRHLQFTSVISHENYLYLLQTVVPSIWSSIESLTIDNEQIPCLTGRFLEVIQDVLPENLKRLKLLHVNLKDISDFISRLTSQCAVEELIIDCHDPEFPRQQLSYGFKIAQTLFFRHPTLKSIEILGDLIFDLSHLSFLAISNSEDSNEGIDRSSNIEPCLGYSLQHKDLSHSFTLQRLTILLRSLNSLHLLLVYQPDLEYLNVRITDATTTYASTITSWNNLREFHFHSDDSAIKFENISELLTYFPHLKSFALNLKTDCSIFFNGEILQTLVHSLESFQFSITRFSAPTLEEQTLSSFYTSFWLENKRWFTQAYWHIDPDDIKSNSFHIYSIPFPFSTFDIDHCSNENIFSKDQFQSYPNVKQLNLSESSDVNVISFLQRCPNVQSIYLNNIFDDEENYGTDEEDEDIEQFDLNLSEIESQTIDSSAPLLPKLSRVCHLILLALPGNDLTFFERLVCATPNLRRLRVYKDDLHEIIRYPQQSLCQILARQISHLEIHVNYLWLLLDIRRDMPRILRIFPKIQSLRISFCFPPYHLLKTLKEIFTLLLKTSSNLLSISIDDTSHLGFVSLIRQEGIELVQTWLRPSSHLELNSSSFTIWL